MIKKYDSTVARIAGNLLSGVLGQDTLQNVGRFGPKSAISDIVTGAVLVARQIVIETENQTPKELA